MARISKTKNSQKSSSARPDARKELGNNVILKARFWLEKDGEIFLASGRVQLLQKLCELGSISSAAEAMGISYHHAWSLIDKINSLSDKPLISTSQGGKGGGGTELTPEAQKLLDRFNKIQNEFYELIAEINVSFKDDDE